MHITQKADTAGPVTVGEMLTEEFLKPLSMSHDELAEAMGICRQDIEDIIYGMRRLRDDEDFWVTFKSCKVARKNEVSSLRPPRVRSC